MPDNDAENHSPVDLASARRSKTGMARLWPALQNSLEGIAATLRTESAFRQEMSLFVVMLPLGLWLGTITCRESIADCAVVSGTCYRVVEYSCRKRN